MATARHWYDGAALAAAPHWYDGAALAQHRTGMTVQPWPQHRTGMTEQPWPQHGTGMTMLLWPQPGTGLTVLHWPDGAAVCFMYRCRCGRRYELQRLRVRALLTRLRALICAEGAFTEFFIAPCPAPLRP